MGKKIIQISLGTIFKKYLPSFQIFLSSITFFVLVYPFGLLKFLLIGAACHIAQVKSLINPKDLCLNSKGLFLTNERG